MVQVEMTNTTAKAVLELQRNRVGVVVGDAVAPQVREHIIADLGGWPTRRSLHPIKRFQEEVWRLLWEQKFIF